MTDKRIEQVRLGDIEHQPVRGVGVATQDHIGNFRFALCHTKPPALLPITLESF
jgi:hypothetical protein